MKKVWLVVLVLVIIALVATGAWIIISSNNETEKTENVINETGANMSTTVNTVNNVIENKNNDVNNEEKNEAVENETENEEIKNDTVNENANNSTEKLSESPKTNEEKAISIVKKDWADEEGVYFSTMGIDSKGRYIVTVNDSNTTNTLAWYAVNVVTGEFEVQ